MTQENVRKIIVRLINDKDFKKSFQKAPQMAIKQSRCDVTEQEIKALLKMNLRDASLYVENRMAPNTLDLETFSSIKSA